MNLFDPFDFDPWIFYITGTFAKRLSIAVGSAANEKERLLNLFSGDWDAGVPTAEDVKFSQEIWRKE